MDKEAIENIVKQVLLELQGHASTDVKAAGIPVGVSNRHIHLSAEHLAALFGCGHDLTKKKELSQVGEFAADETVTLVGPKGVIRGVRVLGPIRKRTQIEISRTDAYLLGTPAPVRDSGHVEGTPGIIIAGACGAVTLPDGVIIAARHIHMHPDDADCFGVRDGDRVTAETDGARGVAFKNVLVRVHENFRLEFHIDTDEANGAGLKNGDRVTLSPAKEG